MMKSESLKYVAWELSFSENGQDSPKCPRCNGPLVLLVELDYMIHTTDCADYIYYYHWLRPINQNAPCCFGLELLQRPKFRTDHGDSMAEIISTTCPSWKAEEYAKTRSIRP